MLRTAHHFMTLQLSLGFRSGVGVTFASASPSLSTSASQSPPAEAFHSLAAAGQSAKMLAVGDSLSRSLTTHALIPRWSLQAHPHSLIASPFALSPRAAHWAAQMAVDDVVPRLWVSQRLSLAHSFPSSHSKDGRHSFGTPMSLERILRQNEVACQRSYRNCLTSLTAGSQRPDLGTSAATVRTNPEAQDSSYTESLIGLRKLRLQHGWPSLCSHVDTAVPTRGADDVWREPAPAAPVFRLESGACCIPHPDKAHRGGEDAFFISQDGSAVGVADGVGGWAEIGVNAGDYARELMERVTREVEERQHNRLSSAGDVREGVDDLLAKEALIAAYEQMSCQGSSTACILVVSNEKLITANLGDSGFVIIRDGYIVFKSASQQHDFNFPYQLGSEGGDDPSCIEATSMPVKEGDIIVAGTDGLFDNVFDSDLVTTVMQSVRAGRSPQATASRVGGLARIRAADRVRLSPFARAAMEAGYRYFGGKMDDITVVVSYVSKGGHHNRVVSTEAGVSSST